jgi:(p)ppGpp synthase/HD superfamily hydrolase
MIQTALQIVKRAFDGKVDKAGKPYIGHLLRVQQTVAAHGGNENQQTVALLHDLLEDTDWTEEDLSAQFPPEVVQAVVVLTKQKGQNYEDYLALVKDCADAIPVKLADLKDNMDLTRLSELTEKDMERVKKYHKAFRFLAMDVG